MNDDILQVGYDLESIFNHLNSLCIHYAYKGESFRSASFGRAAEVVKQYNGHLLVDLTSKKIPGIGKSAIQEIEELVWNINSSSLYSTDRLKVLVEETKQLRSSEKKELPEGFPYHLSNVKGIKVFDAVVLCLVYSIETVEDLAKKFEENGELPIPKEAKEFLLSKK